MNTGAGGVSLRLEPPGAPQELVVALDAADHVDLQVCPGLPQLVPGAGGGHVVQPAPGQSAVQQAVTRGVTVRQQGHRVGLLEAPQLRVCSGKSVSNSVTAASTDRVIKTFGLIGFC